MGLLGGVIKTFLDLMLLLNHPLEEALRHTLINVLLILAVVEVLKTVLIVMLNEIMSNWFKGGTFLSTILLLVIVLVLIVARIFAIRYSPRYHEE